MGALIAVADRVESALNRIAAWSGWLMVALMVVICFDVVTRKFGFQLPGMGSTRLQELEWHLHTVLFSMWLGHCYVLNAHPRVDTATAHRPLRQRAWIELAGCLLFALPYMAIVSWYGLGFVERSFATSEGSEAVIGIPMRWIIKAVFIAGLWFAVAAIVSTILRLVVFLLGGAPAARANLNIDRVPDPL